MLRSHVECTHVEELSPMKVFSHIATSRVFFWDKKKWECEKYVAMILGFPKGTQRGKMSFVLYSNLCSVFLILERSDLINNVFKWRENGVSPCYTNTYLSVDRFCFFLSLFPCENWLRIEFCGSGHEVFWWNQTKSIHFDIRSLFGADSGKL